MLSPGNVDKGSICNSIGQNLGYFVSYILFVTLHDPKTCNKYFRSVAYRGKGKARVFQSLTCAFDFAPFLPPLFADQYRRPSPC